MGTEQEKKTTVEHNCSKIESERTYELVDKLIVDAL